MLFNIRLFEIILHTTAQIYEKSCSKRKRQCAITAKLLDPELSGALLNSVNAPCKLKEQKGGHYCSYMKYVLIQHKPSTVAQVTEN